MLVKAGVDISRLNREIRRALTTAATTYRNLGLDEVVVTSTFEGNHSGGSLHYANDAIDLRLPSRIPDKVDQTVKKLKIELGDAYDVVLEKTHIHIEYDPVFPVRK